MSIRDPQVSGAPSETYYDVYGDEFETQGVSVKRIKNWTIENDVLTGELEDGHPITFRVTDRWLIGRARPFVRDILDEVYELEMYTNKSVRGLNFTG